MYRMTARVRSQNTLNRSRELQEQPGEEILEATEDPCPRSTRMRVACKGEPQQSSWGTSKLKNKLQEQAEEVSYYGSNLDHNPGAETQR